MVSLSKLVYIITVLAGNEVKEESLIIRRKPIVRQQLCFYWWCR